MSNTIIQEITPKKNLFDVKLNELWRYRDLIYLFVKRDFVAVYKQTILGPTWFFIQPIFTSLVMVIVFGNLAGISTDGLPKILFYLSGNVLWNYFATTVTSTSNTFMGNQGIFGKVYFPRLVTPISLSISGLIKLVIQLLLFLVFFLYFLLIKNNASVNPNWELIWLIPILILMVGLLALGFGIIITSLTTKYRDLNFLLAFGIQLAMYATPVVYPLSLVVENFGKYKWIALANPMTSIIESFKYIFLGQGVFDWLYLGYSALFIIVLLFFGVLIFNKTEQNFMDTI
jgi:lipopolysaccharide transport system permease protein